MRAGTREKRPVKAVKKKEYCAQGEEFKTAGNISLPAANTEESHHAERRHTNYSKQLNGGIPDGAPPNHVISPDVGTGKSGSPAMRRQSRRYTGQNINKPNTAPPPPPSSMLSLAAEGKGKMFPRNSKLLQCLNTLAAYYGWSQGYIVHWGKQSFLRTPKV